MTVIAYRDGIVCADSLISIGGVNVGEGRKIFKVEFENGEIIAAIAGDFDLASKFIEWVHGLEDIFIETTLKSIPDKILNCESLMEHQVDDQPFEAFIVVRHKAAADKILTYEKRGIAVEIKAHFYVIGCGRELALGALELGATSEKAVEAAIKYNNYCGGHIQKLSFDEE